VIRRLLLLGRPPETRFFTFIGLFGLVLAAIYWFLSYELAGTAMLIGFGLGGLVIAAALVVGRRSRPTAPAESDGPLSLAGAVRGTPADEVPFEDERGRQPSETLAPLALGLGVAMSLTAVVFGPWLLVAGIVPLAWGAATWLRSARDELAATVRSEDAGSRAAPRAGGPAPTTDEA
jgi:hypothetical protein